MSSVSLVSVPVQLPASAPRAYDILIGSGLLSQLGQQLASRFGQRRIVLVSDTHVAPLYAPVVRSALAAAGHQLLGEFIMPAGEQHKNFATLSACCDALLATKPDRHTLVLALGGGVVGDLAGLAASLLLRGVPYVQIPTTLLAQVDSAVGGKTAVDHPMGKNLLGAFYQPQLVVADTDTLRTLPARELRAGYAEIVKYGLINAPDFFAWCEQNGARLLAGDATAQQHAIQQCCQNKAAIVMADETEQGARALLNLGHTFAHAYETHLGYDGRLLHGEAVALGMLDAARLSVALGWAPPALPARLLAHWQAVGLPTTRPFAINDSLADHLLQLMASDKKATAGQLNFILLRGVGQAELAKNIPASTVRDVLLASA